MNVIVTNKYQELIRGLELDIIKEMNGEFEVDEIISAFQNFFYQRMILDITAIKNYNQIKNIQKLSIALDMDKLILFLGDVPEGDSNEFLSMLISMGIYNFTKNIDGLTYLYNTPNGYRDVAHLQQIEPAKEDRTSKFVAPIKMNKRIIGVENVTSSSGATTLIYMMKKVLSKYYSVSAIEMNKRDFSYFNDKEMLSASDNDISSIINSQLEKDIILIDINGNVTAEGLCNEVLYLIEPSVIKLNKLMLLNRKKLDAVKSKKLVLNQSLLDSKDVSDFEYESKLKIFFNLPPLDERKNDIVEVRNLLQKLGFVGIGEDEVEKKNKILGLFGI